MVSCTCAVEACSASPIAGSDGRYMSIDSGPSPVKSDSNKVSAKVPGRSIGKDQYPGLHKAQTQSVTPGAPSPRRGEGWGEGIRKLQNFLKRPNPLTLAPPDQVGGRSTSPLRGEVKE